MHQIGYSKSPKGLLFTIVVIVRFFKMSNTGLKIRFSQHTIYEFYFLKPTFFPCDFFLICFVRAPQFLLETKRFASIQVFLWFPTLCDFISFSKFQELFSSFFFCFLKVFSWRFRVLCVSLGVIFGTVKLMKF